MPITPGFGSDGRLNISLRPAPLGEHIVCGGCFVIREDNVVVRLNELAMSKPSTHWHRLLGPRGVQEVRVQVGAFGESTNALRMRDNTGQVSSFMTSLRHLWLNDRQRMEVQRGYVFNGARIEQGKLTFEHHLEVIDTRAVCNFAHYAYSMTKCVIYIGAGKKPTFLPFEVT